MYKLAKLPLSLPAETFERLSVRWSTVGICASTESELCHEAWAATVQNAQIVVANPES